MVVGQSILEGHLFHFRAVQGGLIGWRFLGEIIGLRLICVLPESKRDTHL